MLRGMKHTHSRRIHRSPEQIRALLAKFDRHPDSARHFALEQGIPPASFANWLRRRDQAKARSPRWVEVEMPPESPAAMAMVTVDLGQDVKLQWSPGFPASALAQLIRELRPS